MAGDTRKELTVDACVRRACIRHASSVAVVDGGRSLTYAQLDARIDELTAALLALGLGPRDAVVACMRNRLELVVTYLAVQDRKSVV